MRTEHTYACNLGQKLVQAPIPSRSFSTDHFNVVSVLQLFHKWFFASLFVIHLSFFWCLGKPVLNKCGTSWISSFIVLYKVDQR